MTLGERPNLNADQTDALREIEAFLAGPGRCFILEGSAGTGKTTLLSVLAERLTATQAGFCLLAPTGRAARILERATGYEARTIHSAIYTFDKIDVFEDAAEQNEPGMQVRFGLSTDDPGRILIIIDEASMLGDVKIEQDMLVFGSGRLLADLIHHARVVPPERPANAKILFVGDPAQLPPVKETLSPALSAEYLLETFGLNTMGYELTKTMRQAAGSVVLARATELHEAIKSRSFVRFDLAPNGEEISSVSAVGAIDAMLEQKEPRSSSSALITYTNAQTLQYNRSIRGRLWGDETCAPRRGDVLLVNQNSVRYPLSNGDLVRIIDEVSDPERKSVPVRGESEPVNLVFRSTTVAYANADGTVQKTQCRFLENLLQSPERSLPPLEHRALLVDFRMRNPDLRPGSAEFIKALVDDPYFGALQVKYGYALTCHKAQGGEWDMVAIDFSDTRGRQNENFFRWSYTALTRARSRVALVGAPSFDQYTEMQWDAPATPEPVDDNGNKETPPDPDWERYHFSQMPEIFFHRHCLLRKAWQEKQIGIEALDHLQYCERYQVRRSNEHGTVQYWYRGNGEVSRVQGANGIAVASDFIADALSVMNSILLEDGADNITDNDSFLGAFRDRVTTAIDGSGIRLLSSRSMEYRLRMRFEVNGHVAEIDFIYDNKQKWTNATEVGGRGKSGGLIDRLRNLLDA